MATRSRTGSTRTKKSSARSQPAAESTGEPLAPAQSNRANGVEGSATSLPAAEPPPIAEVTGATLERREIPQMSREARIAQAAYWRAERRGFEPGRELEDWLEAEKEIDRQIASEGSI